MGKQNGEKQETPLRVSNFNDHFLLRPIYLKQPPKQEKPSPEKLEKQLTEARYYKIMRRNKYVDNIKNGFDLVKNNIHIFDKLGNFLVKNLKGKSLHSGEMKR